MLIISFSLFVSPTFDIHFQMDCLIIASQSNRWQSMPLRPACTVLPFISPGVQLGSCNLHVLAAYTNSCTLVTLSIHSEWSTLIGRDCRDTVLSLVELVPFGVLLWHDKWLPRMGRIYYRRPYAIKTQRKARNTPHFPPSRGLWVH